MPTPYAKTYSDAREFTIWRKGTETFTPLTVQGLGLIPERT